MKLVFYKSKQLPIGHITTNKQGQKVIKKGPGKWVPVSESSSSGKSISGLTFKDGYYFDGKVKISNNYEKAKKYIEKKQSQSKDSGSQNIKVGDKIRVKANAKSNGKITEHKEARGMVATVIEVAGEIVKIIDGNTGKTFKVKKSSLDFAKSGIISINEMDLIKSSELKVGMKIEKEHLNTIKKIKKEDLNEKQSTKLIAKDHISEAKDKGYEYYKRLLATEGLEDRKGIEGKIIKFMKTHNFIEDEKDIHKFAKSLNMNVHKLEEKIYAILKDIVGNEVKKSKQFIFNLVKSDNETLEKIKKILLSILEKNIEKSYNLIIDLVKGKELPIGTKRNWDDQEYIKNKKGKWEIYQKNNFNNIKKSFVINVFDLIKGKAYPVGTKRDWKGKKFIKVAPGKWRRFYEGDSKGQKLAIAHLKKQIENANSISELAKLVFENKKRFLNSDGTYHNVVKQLLELAKRKRPEKKKEEQKKDFSLDEIIKQAKEMITNKEKYSKEQLQKMFDKVKEQNKKAYGFNKTMLNWLNAEFNKILEGKKDINIIKLNDNETILNVDLEQNKKFIEEIIDELKIGKFDKEKNSFVFPVNKLSLVQSKLAEKIEKDRKQKEIKEGISINTIEQQQEEEKLKKSKYNKKPGDEVNVKNKKGKVVSSKTDENLNTKYDVDIDGKIENDISEKDVKKIPEKEDKKIVDISLNTVPDTRQNSENEINGEEGKDSNLEIIKKSNLEIEKMIFEDKFQFPGESQFNKVKNYTKIREVDIELIKQKDILKKEKPAYILPIEDYIKDFKFDPMFVKIGEDKYIVENMQKKKGLSYQRYDQDSKEYFIVNASVLMATREYYINKAKAEYQKKYDEKYNTALKKAEERYNKSDKEIEQLIRNEYAQYKAGENYIQRVLKQDLEAKKIFQTNKKEFLSGLKKVITKSFSKYDKVRTEKTSSVFYAQSNFFKRVFPFYEGRTITEIVKQKRELNQKLEDMEIQQEFDEGTFSKGRETSYGDSGTKDTLLKDYGVKIKRQNGDEINEKETNQIKKALDDMYKAFGKKDEMSRKWGLKISHAGSKMMHAMKAVGVFFPHFHAIGVTFEGVGGEAGFTMSHEFGHFMDYYLARNNKENSYHFASDNYNSLPGQIASKFRSGMKKVQKSKYYNRTCECFARAMEQYFGQKLGIVRQDDLGVYNDPEKFKENIAPLIESFLSENKDILKSINKKLIFKIK